MIYKPYIAADEERLILGDQQLYVFLIYLLLICN